MKCGDLRSYSSQQMACLAGKQCSKKRNIYVGVRYIFFRVTLIIKFDLLTCLRLILTMVISMWKMIFQDLAVHYISIQIFITGLIIIVGVLQKYGAVNHLPPP